MLPRCRRCRGIRCHRPVRRQCHGALIGLWREPAVACAAGEVPIFRPGDRVRVSDRTPIGHYRVPTYVRGRTGLIEAVIEPALVDNEEEGYGRNAGSKRHYYRVAFAMTELWQNYRGSARDGLRIEVFESWLERSSA
jgi:nitrile hydratase subunit beta